MQVEAVKAAVVVRGHAHVMPYFYLSSPSVLSNSCSLSWSAIGGFNAPSAQTSYVDAPLKRNSYFQGRRLSRKFSRKAARQEGRHSDNVFPRERASERAECRRRRRRAICRNELHFESGWDWEALTYREARCVSGMTNHYYTRILHRWKSFCLSTPS